MPQNPCDPFELPHHIVAECAPLRTRRGWQPFGRLCQSRQSHGEMEPVEQMLGFRTQGELEVAGRVTPIGEKLDLLVHLETLGLEEVEEPTACAMAWVARRRVMDRFAHTDASYLIADSILGELTFVRQALEAAGCERISISGDEAEALALIERERIDLVLVAWDAFHDGLELLHALRRTPEHRQLPVCFIFEAAVDP